MSDTFTGETYNTLCNDAEGYLTKESPEQARELLQKAISLIGTRPRARSLLADTCMSMALWSEARSQLEILITLNEGNTSNNFRLAQVLEELGEYQLAQDNYSVVLDDEPDHHGASVAIKRIETRTKDSGVNLADVFNAPLSDGSGDTDTDDTEDKFKDGLQIFPDVPSDELFADSGADEEDSVERLLKNIGLSGDSAEVEEDDISELLQNIGVSTSQTLLSEFADSEDSRDEGYSDIHGESEDTETEKNAQISLDEIFGTSSLMEEEETKVEPEAEELEEELEEEPEEDDDSPFASKPAKDDQAEPYPLSSDNTLEAIFKAPEPSDAEDNIEPEADEPEEEVIEPEADETEEEVEPEADVSEEEVIEPEADEPEEEEEAEPAEEVKENSTAVLKQEADLTVDPWSPESGLLTVHLRSGTARVKHFMLSIYENSIKVEISGEGIHELSGKGRFLLNCGSQEPLIVELNENMVIRKDAVAFHTGIINIELLDIPKNDSLYVVKDKIREKVIFKTDHPMRVILLGDNNRAYYVRTSSIMATDPEIVLSNTGSQEGYTEITGFGKVYLIE